MISDFLEEGTFNFFKNFFELLISFFGSSLANIMSTAMNVLSLPLVVNGVKYAQVLAFTLLVLKAGNEAFTTYILFENGDPDADPTGLVVRTAQSVAIIAALPWIVNEVFIFGSKVASDVSTLRTGEMGVNDWTFLSSAIISSAGGIIVIFGIIIIIMFLVVAIQASIRGAELALMSIIGPIMALNITANNRSIWSAWFRQLIIICVSQALQIFMISGVISLLTNQAVSNNGLLIVFGWLWLTIKTPNYVKQFAYSTGLTSSMGGATKQAGSMVLMRKMMTKA